MRETLEGHRRLIASLPTAREVVEAHRRTAAMAGISAAEAARRMKLAAARL